VISTYGPIALVGSGEYLEHMAELEAELIAGRSNRYVQIATAAVPDGPAVVTKWHRLGREQAERIGVEAVILPIETREDADNPAIAHQVRDAGLIYLSGGHPKFLADTLRDTLVWREIENAWRAGSALAGCSAGAMALTSWVPSLRHPIRGGAVGLGLLPQLRVIPHFDVFGARISDLAARFLLPKDEENSFVVGIDEDTALVGGPGDWVVRGRQSVWHLSHDSRTQYRVNETLHTPS
jgi:cyanophycinase-like exopeptidase